MMFKKILLLLFSMMFILNAQDFWQKCNMPDGLNIYSLAADNDGVVYAGGYGQGMFKSADDGASWDSSGLAGYWVVDIDINDNGDIFVAGIGSTYGSGILRSTDHGDTWARVFGFDDNWGGFNCVHIDDNGVIWTGLNYSPEHNGIYRSSDNGATWDSVYSDTKNFYTITTKPGGKIFVGSYDRVYRSLDNGKNWGYYETTDDNPEQFNEIVDMAVNKAGEIFLATAGYGIYRSADDGESWIEVKGAGPDYSSLLITANQDIYAATRGYWVYRSADNGGNWELLNSGLTNNGEYGKYILSLCVNSNGYIFSGSDGAGIFRSVDMVSEIAEAAIDPLEFRLEQNYPNPFNPVTTINFQLALAGNVQIAVYNLLGQKVKTLISGKLSAGAHQITFNASEYSSGVYFYKLTTDNGYVQTRKMVLLK
jgi:photosystem II stability/assembly factor-like uncharacterized protein